MRKNNFIFALFTICYLLLAHKASAAILYSQAANQDVYEGQAFVLDWFLDTEGKPINSFDLKINFSKDVLQATEASTGNSLINLWIQHPTIDNQNGSIELIGGIANGINNSQVPIFRTVFQATNSGTASIVFNSASTVLLNDGLGTAEPVKFREIFFNIYPAEFKPLEITSATHPDQNEWYSNNDVELKFTPNKDFDYSVSFSSNIDAIPDNAKHDVPEVFSYPDRPDGIYYFKVNSKVGPPASPKTVSRGGSNWQEAGVYRVQIDKTPPESFVLLIGADPSIFSGKDFVSFSTVDKTSGISHYNIKSGLLGSWKYAVSPYELQRPWVGKHIKVAAVDNAGNKRIETIEYKGLIPVWLFVVLLVIILVGIIYLLRTLRRTLRRKKNEKK